MSKNINIIITEKFKSITNAIYKLLKYTGQQILGSDTDSIYFIHLDGKLRILPINLKTLKKLRNLTINICKRDNGYELHLTYMNYDVIACWYKNTKEEVLEEINRITPLWERLGFNVNVIM